MSAPFVPFKGQLLLISAQFKGRLLLISLHLRACLFSCRFGASFLAEGFLNGSQIANWGILVFCLNNGKKCVSYKSIHFWVMIKALEMVSESLTKALESLSFQSGKCAYTL